MAPQDGSKLREEREIAHGGAGLRRHPARRPAAPAARELVADVDHPSGEVDVIPAQAEHLGEPHARVGAGRKQRPVADGARREQASELGLTEHAQARRRGMRALIPLQTGERVRNDVATAEGEAENAAERSEHPFDRPGREPLRLESVHDRDEVVGRD